MSRPLVTVINLETNEKINREMNDQEYAQYLVDIEAEQARIAEENNGN